MSDAYSKYLNKNMSKKPSRKLISLEESMDSHNDEIMPNVFIDSGSVAQSHKNLHIQERGRSIHQNYSRQTNNQNQIKSRTQKKVQQRHVIQLVDDEEIDQGEEDERRQKGLSISQSVNLSLGHHYNFYKYPISREIPIIANNEDIEREKYQNTSYISQAFDNDLSTSFFLFFVFGVLSQSLIRLQYLLWLAAVVVSFVLSSLYSPQYMANQYILLCLFLVAILIDCILVFLGIRKRRSWKDRCEDTKYRVYHYENKHAEWVPTNSTDLKPGSIYKVNANSVIPADSLLLHSNQSIVQISQNGLFSSLTVQPPLSLKQTIIKADVMFLPLTGVITLSIHQPQLKYENVHGKLVIQEPMKSTHTLEMDNILLRGSVNISQNELLCVVLQTGIDSILLKQGQYPYQYRQLKQNMEIAEIRNFIKWSGVMTSVCYLLMLGVGVLIGYIYTNTMNKGYYIQDYISSVNVDMLKIFLYHLTNYIMFIPILLRFVYLIYLTIMGSITQKKACQENIEEEQKTKRQVKLKDVNALTYIHKLDTVVTTIDTFINPNIKLHSIKVKEIFHNFQTKSIDDQLYSTEDVDLINYFLSVSLLTIDLRPKNTNDIYDFSLRERCSLLNLKSQRTNHGEVIINGDQFRVYQLFIIPHTYHFPLKLVFYQTSGTVEEVQKKNTKVLCLVRGQPQYLLDKVYGKVQNLEEYSKRLHEEKGFHNEVLCKMTLSFVDYEQIRFQYESGNTSTQRFYEGLNRYLMNMQVMGLLMWQNEYKSESPFINGNYERLSQMNKIVIIPHSKSFINPQFETIHSITNFLINTFKLPLTSLSDKILHSCQSPQLFIENLKNQKILILNGWDNKMIKECLRSISDKVQLLGYTNNDQFSWMQKEVHFSVTCEGVGYDLEKYSDAQVTSITDIVDVISYDSAMIRVGIINLVTIQIRKSLILLTIQFINSFYTWGTGLVIVTSPLHILLEIVLILDIFYFLNFRHQKLDDYYEEYMNWKFFAKEFIISILVGAFMTFIPVYSMQGPTTMTGTLQSSAFTHILIHFILVHCLIFYKLFLPPFSFSLFKLLFIVLQIAFYYVGIIIISEFDLYQFKGIIWYCFQGRIILTGIFSVWMIITCNWLYFIFKSIWVSTKKDHEKLYMKKEENRKVKSRRGTSSSLME